MPRSLICAALAAAALAAAPAHAAEPGVEKGLRLAHRAFGPVTCGTATVTRGDFVDAQVMAGGDVTRCEIILNRRWVREMTPAMRCTLVMHEYGHLAGRPHSPDPDSVMFHEYRRADPRCLRASTAARGPGTSESARSGS